MATDFNSLAAGLRAWAAGSRNDEAAVELLIWHETWLRRRDFAKWAIMLPGRGIDWRMAREFLDKGEPLGSTSELAVLNLAIALGEDAFGLSGLGLRHKRKAAEAFAHACDWRLEGDMPEPGHSHPDFIPGTPETCGACAREAKDEGRR
jgi:hypothetical protein